MIVTPLSEQLWAMLAAALAGMLCGAVYDVFRCIRWGSQSRRVELLLDALFSLLAAAVLFVVVTSVTQLRLRGFLLLSAAGGWLVWNATGGRLLRWIIRQMASLFASAAHRLARRYAARQHNVRQKRADEKHISEK